MFTWICPQCGREVPPSYSECPACAENRQRAAQGLPPIGAAPAPPQPPPPAQPAWQPPPPQQAYQPPAAPQYQPPPQPQYQPPSQSHPMETPTSFFQPGSAPPVPQSSFLSTTAYPPPQPAAAPPPPPQPPPAWPAAPQPQQPQQAVYTLPDAAPSRGIPTWLVAILVAALAIGGLFLAYRFLGNSGSSATSAAQTQTALTPVPGADSNPYAKFVEVSGIRITEDEKQKARLTFVVINHSAADLPSLNLQVTLRTTTAKPEDEPVAVVDVATGPVAANASKDVSSPLKTTLRAYELPDWQFLRASFTIAASK